jgi:hypothetical protein
MPKKIMMPRKIAGRKPGRKQKKAPEDALDLPAVKAAQMYDDPCGADLTQSVYPGDIGYLNRFTAVSSGGVGATETATVYIFKPGNNVAHATSAATPGSTFTIAYADTLAPGAAFLNTTATKVRCAGACITVRPLSAPNTCTGQIYFGNVAASSVANGLATLTYNSLAANLSSISASQALMEPLEIKWSPGSFDDRYSPTTSITEDDDTDRNVLVVVVIGLPAAAGVQFRTTAIYEWAPLVSQGIQQDTTQVKASRCDFNCVLRNLKRKDSQWWWNLGTKVVRASQKIGVGYYTGGVVGAATALAKFI